MNETLSLLQDYHVTEILFGLGVLLVVIDYLFPTDIACQFGYFSLAAATFFAVDFPISTSLLIAIVVWVILIILHFAVLKKYLDNVPDEPVQTA